MINLYISKFGKWISVEGSFASWFVLIGILTQLITCYIMKESAIAVCSGIAGVITVVLCSQKKYTFYFWSILQLITIIIISINNGLYGKIFENGFYLITLFVGMQLWQHNMDNDVVEIRKMDLMDYIIFGLLITPISLILSYLIVINYNSGQIALDIITTTIGIVAQIMMILRFRAQWILWFVLDILCIILWAKVGNWCLVAQYVF